MNDGAVAVLIWLPAGTILPFIVSRLTGADRQAAIIEAAIFAFFGLLLYPTLFGLLIVRFVSAPNVEILFGAGFVVAALTVIGYRRGIAPTGRR